jgi:hypothetical protein
MSPKYLVEYILSLLDPAKMRSLPQITMQLTACQEVLLGFVDVSSLLHGIFEKEDAPRILAILVSGESGFGANIHGQSMLLS